jgi:hypothetical protein
VTGVGRRAGIGYAISRQWQEPGAAGPVQADAVAAELTKLGRVDSEGGFRRFGQTLDSE